MHNAKGLATKIRAKLGKELERVCFGTLVSPALLAGLISVENARLDPEASRFEKHVFTKLKRLRNPLVFWRREWNGITQQDLRGASDEALINLATSFSFTQIMGWWSIPLTRILERPVTVGMIRNQHQHLELAVRLLEHTGRRYLRVHNYGAVLRIWNTGKPDGRTHDPRYVANALAVMNEYRRLASARVRTSETPRKPNDAPPVTPAPGSPANSP